MHIYIHGVYAPYGQAPMQYSTVSLTAIPKLESGTDTELYPKKPIQAADWSQYTRGSRLPAIASQYC